MDFFERALRLTSIPSRSPRVGPRSSDQPWAGGPNAVGVDPRGRSRPVTQGTASAIGGRLRHPSLNSQHSTLNLLPLPSAPSHPNTRIQIPATPDLGPPPGPGSGIPRLRPGKHLLVVQMQRGDGAVLSRVEVDIGPSTTAIPEARPERVLVPVLEPAVQTH